MVTGDEGASTRNGRASGSHREGGLFSVASIGTIVVGPLTSESDPVATVNHDLAQCRLSGLDHSDHADPR